MRDVALTLKQLTSSKQNDTEENHLLDDHEKISESNKGTMDLNNELLSDCKLNLCDIDIIEMNSNLNLQNQVKPENNSLKSKAFELI